MNTNSKQKGNRAERELLEILRPWGAERHDQRYIGGKGNPDIGAVIAGHPCHVEVKRVERLNVHAAYQQAQRDAENAVPMVCHRRSREPWLVTMELGDLLTMIGGEKQ